MGKAKFKLSGWELEKIMNLPYCARILDIKADAYGYTICVESPDLPDNIEIRPNWDTSNFSKFIDWGIQKLSDDIDHEMKLDYDPCG